MMSTQTQPAAPDPDEPTAIVANKATPLAALAWSEDADDGDDTQAAAAPDDTRTVISPDAGPTQDVELAWSRDDFVQDRQTSAIRSVQPRSSI
jgi:hypothetical protein